MLNYIKLTKGETWKPSRRSGPPPRVRDGQAWVTMRGCEKDFILAAGDELPQCGDSLVVESLSAELMIELDGAY